MHRLIHSALRTRRINEYPRSTQMLNSLGAGLAITNTRIKNFGEMDPWDIPPGNCRKQHVRNFVRRKEPTFRCAVLAKYPLDPIRTTHLQRSTVGPMIRTPYQGR